MSMLNPTKEGLGAAQYAKYSVFNFLKHPDLDSFKRTGKVSFVQCKKWLVFHEPLVQWSRSVVNINKWSDNGTLRLLFNALKLRKLWKHCQNDYKSIIISYHSIRNFQLNPKLKSNFGFMLKKAKIGFKVQSCAKRWPFSVCLEFVKTVNVWSVNVSHPTVSENSP